MAFNAGGALGGAASGGQAGSMFGPVGTAIGAGAGGLLGGKGGGKGKAPAAPDFMGLATAGQNTPWGGTNWTKDPQTGQYSQNVTVPGAVQGAFGNIQNNMLSATNMDPAQARDQAINQNLGFGMSRLMPMFGEQNKAFDAGMANEALDPGTEAYTAANRALGNRQTDMFRGVYTDALNMGNQTQQTQMQQAMQPFMQYGSLIGSSLQRPNMPNLPGAGAMNYEAALNNYNANSNSMLGGLGALGSFMGGGGGGLGSLLGGKGGGGTGPRFSAANPPTSMSML